MGSGYGHQGYSPGGHLVIRHQFTDTKVWYLRLTSRDGIRQFTDNNSSYEFNFLTLSAANYTECHGFETYIWNQWKLIHFKKQEQLVDLVPTGIPKAGQTCKCLGVKWKWKPPILTSGCKKAALRGCSCRVSTRLKDGQKWIMSMDAILQEVLYINIWRVLIWCKPRDEHRDQIYAILTIIISQHLWKSLPVFCMAWAAAAGQGNQAWTFQNAPTTLCHDPLPWPQMQNKNYCKNPWPQNGQQQQQGLADHHPGIQCISVTA